MPVNGEILGVLSGRIHPPTPHEALALMLYGMAVGALVDAGKSDAYIRELTELLLVKVRAATGDPASKAKLQELFKALDKLPTPD